MRKYRIIQTTFEDGSKGIYVQYNDGCRWMTITNHFKTPKKCDNLKAAKILLKREKAFYLSQKEKNTEVLYAD